MGAFQVPTAQGHPMGLRLPRHLRQNDNPDTLASDSTLVSSIHLREDLFFLGFGDI